MDINSFWRICNLMKLHPDSQVGASLYNLIESCGQFSHVSIQWTFFNDVFVKSLCSNANKIKTPQNVETLGISLSSNTKPNNKLKSLTTKSPLIGLHYKYKHNLFLFVFMNPSSHLDNLIYLFCQKQFDSLFTNCSSLSSLLFVHLK